MKGLPVITVNMFSFGAFLERKQGNGVFVIVKSLKIMYYYIRV